MKTKLMTALVLVTMLTVPAVAQDHTGWLADNANMLGDQEKQSIQSAIESVYQTTGARICVRTISSSNGDDVKHIAVQTLNNWNPGPKSVMVLVCLDPKMIYLQPGTELKYVFDLGVATAICHDTIAPHFKQSNHAAGLLAGIQAVQTRLMSPAGTTYSPQSQSIEPPTFLGLTAKTWVIIIMVVLILFLFLWLASRSSGYSSGGGYYSSNTYFFGGGGGSDSSSSSSYDSGGSSWSGDSGGSCDGGGGGGSSW
jgi:uncharacterized membrane protein YgcG